MAPRKTASDEATVEVVEAVETVEVADVQDNTIEVAPLETVAAPSPGSQEGVNPLLLQPRKKGIPNNTWRLYYGNVVFDCVQGVEREFPEDVYDYLKRSGNILPPNF